MVSQGQVESAFEAINKPCTVADVLVWMLEHKYIDVIPTPKNNTGYGRTRGTVQRMIQKLRTWKVVDRLPQGHSQDQMPIWYLVKNGDPHVTPCKICHEVAIAYAKHCNKLMSKYMSRRTVHQTEAAQRYISEEV